MSQRGGIVGVDGCIKAVGNGIIRINNVINVVESQTAVGTSLSSNARGESYIMVGFVPIAAGEEGAFPEEEKETAR